jgi:hypothetical protein
MMLYRLGFGVCLLAFAIASCNGTGLNVGMPQNASTTTTPNSPSNQNNKSDKSVLSLDLQHPEIIQKILPDDGDPTKARFVQVEVIKVTNPQKRPAQFEVHYQPNDGEKILLGAFSLYPPDNPGKFIVPTQGKVKAEGKLILSLVKSDLVVAGDEVKVDVYPMKFVKG